MMRSLPLSQFLFISCALTSGVLRAQPNVPDGFKIEIYMTEGVYHPSAIAWGPDGRMYFSELVTGEIKIINDNNQDGYGDDVRVFATGFDSPVGLAWKADSLYVSSRGTITIVRDTNGDDAADEYSQIISGWPTFWHQNNQLVFDEEGYFFVALGAWEDRTEGPSVYNNKILRISPDGSNIQIWADGIRNVFDLAFSPQGFLFGGDNGWQEHTPGGHPEELNYYAEGRHYGYPDYLGDPPTGTGTIGPLVEFPEHTAPTGVMFYTGGQFPEEYRNDLYIAFYGPDNYDEGAVDIAYRIVRCNVVDSVVTDTIEFADRFYAPVDLLQDSVGNMYVADIGGVSFRPSSVDGHIYRISYVGGPSSADEEPAPLTYELHQNYPNPFNPSTTIEFSLPRSGFVTLKVYNVLGEEVAALASEDMPAGTHTVRWNAEGFASGVYFYQLRTAGLTAVRQMMLIK